MLMNKWFLFCLVFFPLLRTSTEESRWWLVPSPVTQSGKPWAFLPFLMCSLEHINQIDFLKTYHTKKSIFRSVKDPSVTCGLLLAFCKQCTEIQIDRLNKWPLFLLLLTWFIVVMDVGRKCFLEGLVFWIDQECTCRANPPITLSCHSLVHIRVRTGFLLDDAKLKGTPRSASYVPDVWSMWAGGRQVAEPILKCEQRNCQTVLTTSSFALPIWSCIDRHRVCQPKQSAHSDEEKTWTHWDCELHSYEWGTLIFNSRLLCWCVLGHIIWRQFQSLLYISKRVKLSPALLCIVPNRVAVLYYSL